MRFWDGIPATMLSIGKGVEQENGFGFEIVAQPARLMPGLCKVGHKFSSSAYHVQRSIADLNMYRQPIMFACIRNIMHLQTDWTSHKIMLVGSVLLSFDATQSDIW